MKEDREIKELNKIIKAFDKLGSVPSMEFELTLKNKLLTANNSEFNGFFGKLFFGIGKINISKQLGYIFSIIFAFVLISSFYYYFNNRYTLHEKIRTIEGNEQYSLLSQVYANNPQALLSFDKPLQTSTISDTLNKGDVNELVDTPEVEIDKNFNYFHLLSSTYYGDYSVNCVGLNTDNTNIELFSYEGNNSDNEKYFKFIEYNSDNSILDYQLINNNQYYRYFGAATTIVYQLINTDNSLISTDNIENVFGVDVKLEEIITGDRMYYKITRTQPNDFCFFNDEDIESGISDGDLITILLIDPLNDFAVIEAQYYFNIEELTNQIMVIKNNQERKVLGEMEAKNIFSYDLPYPIEMELTPIYMDVKGLLKTRD